MRASWSADLGRIARQRRRDLGWSQEELAAKAEVTRQWLTRFETDTGDPALSKVMRVLRELELHVDVAAEERAAVTRPRVTIPVYTPATVDKSPLAAAREQSALVAPRGEEPDEEAPSSASAATHDSMAGAMERLSRSQQRMRGQAQRPSGSRPVGGEDHEEAT